MHSLSPKVRSFHPELSSLLFTEFVNGVLVPVKILFFFSLISLLMIKSQTLSRIPSNTFHCFAFPF